MAKQISIYDGGVWRDATHVYIYTSSGAWAESKGMWIYDGATWQKGWPPVTSQSNWVDPDGGSDGINAVSSTAGTQEVAAASRIYMDLATPFSSTDTYHVVFRFSAQNDPGAGNSQAIVDVEVSSDGGSFASLISRTISLTTPDQGDTQTYGADFTSPATGSIRVRLKLSANNIDSTGQIDATLYAYLTTWNSDNYAVSWE